MAGEATARGGWYYGWNIVAVCALAGVAANALAVNAFSLFLRDWSNDLGVSISTLQIGLAIGGTGSALLSPFAGALVDRYAPRRLFTIGLCAMVVFCLGMSFVTRFWQYVALYAVFLPVGLLLSTTLPANALVLRWFTRRRGLAMSLTALGLGMAGVVMPPIIAAVMPAIGWRLVWRAAAVVIAVVILPLVVLVLRDRPTEREGLHYVTGDAAPAAHGHGGGGVASLRWRDILARRNFWLMLLAYIPMLGLYGGCAQNLGPIAASRGFAAGTAGVLLSLLSISQLGATLLGGLMSDRFGNRVPLMGLGLCTALGGVLVAFGTSLPVFGLGVTLAGFGGAFWPVLAAALAAEYGTAGLGRAFGLVTFFVPLTSLMPVLVAKIQESTGSYTPAFLAITAITLFGALMCVFLRERRGGDAVAAHAAAVPVV